MYLIRKTLFKYLVILYIGTSYTYANDFNLPNLGTPSDSSLSPIKEKEIRDSIVNQIYQYDLVMLDPIVADYMEQLGYRLAAQSENPQAPFDFFIVNDNTINASTYPGGLIIFFSGLFLRTETESELAGVMAHEIAHATQRHISRFYADNKKNTIPMLLGLAAAVVAAQASNSGDAPLAIAATTQALVQQAMINFTRANEYEADRVGIDNLKKADFNPLGMAGFFEKLMRENPIDERYLLPEYLRTHPLSINRVTEAKSRAGVNPDDVYTYTESEIYPLVKERIRLLTKNVEMDNVNYYRKLFEKKSHAETTQAEKYGYALALHYSQENKEALDILNTATPTDQTVLLFSVLRANIYSELDWNKSYTMFEKLYRYYPQSPVVIMAYIKMLSKSKEFKYRKKARLLARDLVELNPDKPNYYQTLAITNQNLGKIIEANEALAIKEHKINNNYRAVRILKNVLKSELNYYQRARIEAKITKYENLITDKERSREKQEDITNRRR